jgi:hypothetical protein
MYQLGLCELHCFALHGGSKMLGHYLLISTFKDFSSNSDNEIEEAARHADDDDDDSECNENIFEEAQYYNESYAGERIATVHPFIRNYNKIINSLNYIKPEIMKVLLLSTGETVAILKTFWIRIFQRTWRRKFAKRVAFLKNIHTIQLSRLNGRVYYRG